jgi:hypothetical protein
MGIFANLIVSFRECFMALFALDLLTNIVRFITTNLGAECATASTPGTIDVVFVAKKDYSTAFAQKFNLTTDVS